MSKSNNKVLGAIGEDKAASYLEKKGYNIIERNFRCRSGEIDIIARHDSYFVFIEVKTRTSYSAGSPIESITNYKISQIIKTAQVYIKQKNLYDMDIRFDVVSITVNKDKFEIKHIKNVIEG